MKTKGAGCLIFIFILVFAMGTKVYEEVGPAQVQISGATLTINHGEYQPLEALCSLEMQRCTLKSAGISGTPYVPEFEIAANPGDKPGVLFFKISNARVEPGESSAAEIRPLQGTHYAVLVPTDGNWYTFNVYHP